MPYAAKLEGFPNIPLMCSTCREDWRYFDGVKNKNGGRPGIPQGLVKKEEKTVFLRQEIHRKCKNCRCKPDAGTTVTIEGIVYKVTSGQDSQFRG